MNNQLTNRKRNEGGNISASPENGNRQLSRRSFANTIARVIGLGAFSHFSLMSSNAAGAEIDPDGCPGGLEPQDICLPDSNANQDNCPGGREPYDKCFESIKLGGDECPGELPSEDECDKFGMFYTDECASGQGHSKQTDADKCDLVLDGSDQCESGMSDDDNCPPKGVFHLDVCPNGKSNDPDDCATKPFDVDAGDECPGGNSVVDTCYESGEGDQCSPEIGKEGYPPDTCDPDGAKIDKCLDGSADICPDGKNSLTGSGFSDACGDIVGISLGSDSCPDGLPDNDICAMISQRKETDTCPGGGVNVDTCSPDDGIINSDDYCVAGRTNTDECHGAGTDKDECPGGGSSEDKCVSGLPAEDECPGGKTDVDYCPTGNSLEDECPGGGCAGGDQESPAPIVIADLCLLQILDGCTLPMPDHVE